MSPNCARSSCFYNWTYDVFLNFRGSDTRTRFTGHLYDALRRRGIHTFFDDEGIQRGEEISSSLFKAIKESRMAITVFSPNYASSAYCLNELVHILECIKGQGRLVWPVFYDVDPSQVRHQKGIYGEALARHEERYGKEKVHKWRSALFEVANLSGLEIKLGSGYEYVYIERIIKDVSTKINRIPLHVVDCPVGLVSRVLEVNSLLEVGSDKGVSMVGILGIGGIGKTTIARAVYNLIGDKFEGLCFLSSVREINNKHGVSHLQETILAEVVGEKDIKLGGDVNKGVSIIKHRLNRKKVLLVLDDVDKLQQLQAMAGNCDWFGCGSRIVITTRDKHLLARHGVERIYAVKELNDEEALKFFSWKAFGQDVVDPNYLEISKRVILYSSGLPLALEVIGSNIYGKGIDEWNSALDGYKKTPDTKIFEILKLSYDTLEYNEKEIFLDVACIFKGYNLEYVKEMLLNVRDINSEYAIGVLLDKSLIKIECGHLTMHDLVQDMGKEIIRQESPKEPGGCSRLWFYMDILHVLQENTGTDKIEVLILDLPKGKEEVQWSGKAFKKMKNLRMLIIRNAYFTSGPTYLPNSLRVLDWSHYPGIVLPSNFHPTNFFSLNLRCSSCVSLGPLITKKMENLTFLDFRGCKFLTQVPDLSGVINLKELWLDDCPSLIEIHDSVGFLSKLRVLRAIACVNLKTLPRVIRLTSLEHLYFSGCSSLQSFPEVLDKMEKTKYIYLNGTAIEELPYSIKNLTCLQELSLWDCIRLKQLPASVLKLSELEWLTTSGCSEFRHFSKCEGEEGEGVSSVESSEIELDFDMCNLSGESLSICLSCSPNLTRLDLSFNSITILPACIKTCHLLRELYVQNCEQLRLIEGMPPNLELFMATNCVSLTPLSSGMLLNQAFHGHGSTEFYFPGQKVPEWFHHYSNGDSTQFWVRKEFPTLAVCVVLSVLGYENAVFDRLCLCVNDTMEEIYLDYDCMFLKPTVDHICLCYLQRTFREGKLQDLLLPDQWNHVEVLGIGYGAIKSIGIHVYKQENTMDNILFSMPFSLNRTCHDLYNSNNDLAVHCYPLTLDVENGNSSEWLSLHPCWQEPPLSYVNEDSNSMALASTSDTISGQDGAPMHTSSEKQPSKIEMEIRLASLGPTIPPLECTTVSVVEENHEEVGLSNNQETFCPPNFKTNEVSMNTSMDFKAINKMIKEDPMSAIESLLTANVSVSSKMLQSATQLVQPEVQISSVEALQKELKILLTKFDLSSLISDDIHRSNICFYIEDLEKKFESLPPAHRTFIQNLRNFFINATLNHDKLNEFSNKQIQLKVEKEDVLKKLQEARAKDERMSTSISSANLRVKEIVSSIEELESQLMKLRQEKKAFELAINECGKQKEKLRTDCISWAHQSRDLVVKFTDTEEMTRFLEDQVEADETNFLELVALIPF